LFINIHIYELEVGVEGLLGWLAGVEMGGAGGKGGGERERKGERKAERKTVGARKRAREKERRRAKESKRASEQEGQRYCVCERDCGSRQESIYRVAKTHRMPYLDRSFSAKEPYN